MDLQSLLKPLEELEESLGDLYEGFSRLFEEDEEAASLFYRMARDERSHAILIRYERRLLRQNKIEVPTPLEQSHIREALARIRAFSREAPPTLEEAIRFALEIENHDSENHTRFSKGVLPASLTRLLGRLGREDLRHYRNLLDFAGRRGKPFAGGEERS
ncbi:MAG: hypothetical protein ACP5VF_02420 [Acidobacteriota bacterium]